MPDLTIIINVVATLAALSASTERLVEIVKGCFKWLNEPTTDADVERRRKIAIQTLGVACGALTAWLGREFLPPQLQATAGTLGGSLVFGLMLSGGSGFWNAILGYLRGIKDIKSLDAREMRRRIDPNPHSRTAGAAPAPTPNP